MACGTLNKYPDQKCHQCQVPEGFDMKKDIDWGHNIWGEDKQEDIDYDKFNFRLQVDLPTFSGLDLNRIAAEGEQIDRNLFFHDETAEKVTPERIDRVLDQAFGDGWLSDDERFLGNNFMGDGWLSDDDDDEDGVPQTPSFEQAEPREIVLNSLFQ